MLLWWTLLFFRVRVVITYVYDVVANTSLPRCNLFLFLDAANGWHNLFLFLDAAIGWQGSWLPCRGAAIGWQGSWLPCHGA